MIHSIVLNIDAGYIDLTRIAIHALLRTIPATAECFKVDAQRQFIIDGLVKAANIDDIDT